MGWSILRKVLHTVEVRAPEAFAVLEEEIPEAEYLVNFDPSKISTEEQTYFSYDLRVSGVRALSESF